MDNLTDQIVCCGLGQKVKLREEWSKYGNKMIVCFMKSLVVKWRMPRISIDYLITNLFEIKGRENQQIQIIVCEKE